MFVVFIFLFFSVSFLVFKWFRFVFLLLSLEFVLMGCFFFFVFSFNLLGFFFFLLISVISSILGVVLMTLLVKEFGFDKCVF